MLTTLDSSPTSTTPAFVQPTNCGDSIAPDTQTTTEQQQQQQQQQQREILKSPSKQQAATTTAQDHSCAKHPSSKMKHSSRHTPYPEGTAAARSPGSCSSDGDSVQSDGDNQDVTRLCSKVKRIAANSRERKRMHTVNSAFDQLRELVPTYPSNRKLSKIDTLRLACTYIQDLVSLLQHNTQAIQGEDVLYQQPPFSDTFSYPVAVKPEPLGDFPPYEHFRMPLRFPTDACTESYASSASESDSTAHSPPHHHPHPHPHHHFMQAQQQQQQQQVPPPPPPPCTTATTPPASVTASPPCTSSRPPPLTRVSSEGTATIHARMAEATISGIPAVSQQQQQAPSLPIASTATTTPMSLPPAVQQQQQPTSVYQRQVQITSPLAMHSVHHHHHQQQQHHIGSSPLTPPTASALHLQGSTLGHHSPPPVWQRPAAVPSYAHPLYGQ